MMEDEGSLPAILIFRHSWHSWYQAEFLARILADPAGTLPPPREAMVRMPNLDLRPGEIASLVAFINGQAVTAAR
ncbi:MAG: hypothetical protein ACRD1U_04745 [Vicinamibacterales bacterium]